MHQSTQKPAKISQITLFLYLSTFIYFSQYPSMMIRYSFKPVKFSTPLNKIFIYSTFFWVVVENDDEAQKLILFCLTNYYKMLSLSFCLVLVSICLEWNLIHSILLSQVFLLLFSDNLILKIWLLRSLKVKKLNLNFEDWIDLCFFPFLWFSLFLTISLILFISLWEKIIILSST